MKPFYLSVIALLLSVSLFCQAEEIIPLTGSWELTRIENLNQANSSFTEPPWVGSKFHLFADGSLAMENQGEYFLTTFQREGQTLSYESNSYEIDRQFKDYWTFLFVDEANGWNCRLHFVAAEEDLAKVPEASEQPRKQLYPLGGNAPAAPAPAASNSDGPTYKVVEQMPRFPGCEDLTGEQERKTCAQQELLKYIYKNLRYPEEMQQNGIEGTVVVTFVIDVDGSTTDARVVRDIGAGCGEEALRVVNEMTTKGLYWTPGMQRGKPVRVQFNLPIKFKLP